MTFTTPTAPASQGARAPVAPEAVKAALARLLSSDPVRGSGRTAAFLTYTVGEVLAGRGHHLKERTVAAGALGRGAGFDPRVDPAVRVQARRVRVALERYYAGSGAADPVRIELPRGGYAPVFRPHDPAADARAANGHGPGSNGHVPAAPTGVAVVSLANLTPGGGLDHLAPGLSETLVAGLARLPGCRVIGPIAPGNGGGPDLQGLRERHGVRFVLAGSARAHDMAVRVSVRLVDAVGGETTWSMVFDGRLDGEAPFDIEDRIVAEVARALAGHRGERGAGSPPGLPGRTDPAVLDAVLRYYAYLGDSDAGRVVPTIRALEAASRREPDNALVLSMLAGMNLLAHVLGMNGPEDPLARAEDLARRATAIDPVNPHAMTALAWIALAHGRVETCHRTLERMLVLCPDRPAFLSRAGFVFAQTGEWERGLDLIRASIRLDAARPGWLGFFPAMDLCMRGDDDAALRQAALVDTPAGHLGPIARMVPLARLGRVAEARAELEALRRAVPDLDEDRAAALRRMLLPEPVRAMILTALDAIDPHSRLPLPRPGHA